MKLNLYFFSMILSYMLVFVSCDEKEQDKSPVADFSIKIEGYKVQFINLSDNGESYNWNFGDDNQSTDKDPEHVYESAGKFSVTLQVTNAAGTDEITKEVEIEELYQGDRVVIDGKFNDWSEIISFTPGQDAEYKALYEVKVCSNQQFVYVYFRANKEMFPTGYISTFFDYDLSIATGYKPWFADGGFETLAQSSVEFRDGALFLYTGNPGEANWLWEELASNGSGFNVWSEPKENTDSFEVEFSLDRTKIMGLGTKTTGVSFYFEKDWVTQGLIPANGQKPILLNLETGIASLQN
ncbi:MAG: PKD domain-containing protein [Paludibacter sp.]|nr:PKD domain-containing protein [Paludibacter sp.]